MKFAAPSLFATMLAIALPAFAASPTVLTKDDVLDAVHVFEHDTSSLHRLIGHQVALTLRKTPNTPYFEFDQGSGIAVECGPLDAFTGGPVNSTIRTLAITDAHGPDVAAVLTLQSCTD